MNKPATAGNTKAFIVISVFLLSLISVGGEDTEENNGCIHFFSLCY